MRLLNTPMQDDGTQHASVALPLCEDPCAEHLLRTGGYCKLLAEAGQWQSDAVAAAAQMMQEQMAFVPSGPVQLKNIAVTEGHVDECGSVLIEEGHFFIDRLAVTNSQFKRFTDADAYRDASFWPVQIQPYVFQFVDSSGAPGPANWHDAHYEPDKRDHPVVGISWHEANAFANWMGKRLPTSSQWQRAGTWWNSDARYPWGPSFEEGLANTYSAGLCDTSSVLEYSHSATPNGILQLVGNVWEWVDACFAEIEFQGRTKTIELPLGEIRGGAFDTYLASQATCTFRSGIPLLNRNHNVGFRCVANSFLLTSSNGENL